MPKVCWKTWSLNLENKCDLTCSGCNSLYIGKTNRTLFVLTQEHAITNKESAIYIHLRYCDQIKHIQGLYNLPGHFYQWEQPNLYCSELRISTQTKRGNTKIIHSDDNCNVLQYYTNPMSMKCKGASTSRVNKAAKRRTPQKAKLLRNRSADLMLCSQQNHFTNTLQPLSTSSTPALKSL